MKRKMMILFTVLCIGMTGCTQNQTVEPSEEANVETKDIIEEEEPDKVIEVEEPNVENSEAEHKVEEKSVTVAIYRINENEELVSEDVVLEDGLDEKEIWKELQNVKMISQEANLVELSIEENGNLLIDVDSGFATYLGGMGSTGENEVLKCIVYTFLDAYQSEGVMITVEGGTLESGHQVYDNTLQKGDFN